MHVFVSLHSLSLFLSFLRLSISVFVFILSVHVTQGMVVDRPSEYRRMSREYTILAGRYAGWAYAWAQRHRMPYAPVLFMSEKAAHEANSVAATQSQPDH